MKITTIQTQKNYGKHLMDTFHYQISLNAFQAILKKYTSFLKSIVQKNEMHEPNQYYFISECIVMK